jgi:hypothetical protein
MWNQAQFFFCHSILVILSLSTHVTSFVVVPKSSEAKFQTSLGTSSNDGMNDRDTSKQVEFLEQASLNGADKIREMSIEERTRRAMLAEAAEDRIISLSIELESLLGEDGLPSKVEDRDEVVNIARQIKGCQEQYNQLVTGEDSSTLNMLNAESNSFDSDKDFQ